MTFLVTGSSGLVGSQLVMDLFRLQEKTHSCYHTIKPKFGIPRQMDLTDPESIGTVIQKVRPKIILHLAAMTNLDICEKEKKLASDINEEATKIISEWSAKMDAFLLYVSTDYVFDGKKGMKKETDKPNPINFYAKTKFLGEQAVTKHASKWCIARTSTPFGLHPSKLSFPLFVAKSLHEQKKMNVITDQFTSPTYIPNLSKMLIEIAKRKIEGYLHVSGRTRISRYDTAELVSEKMNFDKKLINPITCSEMSWLAKRPKDSSLDVSKAISILKEKPLSINESMDFFIPEIKSWLYK